MNARERFLLDSLPAAPEFGYWFAGLIDGEGCFSIATRDRGYGCSLIIKLRGDDMPMLAMIRDELRLGVLSEGYEKGHRPYARWVVSTKAGCLRLTELFDAFPLRSKKARDYAIWREAVIHWANSNHPVDWEPIRQAYDDLRAVRAFRAFPPLDVAKPTGLPPARET